VLPSRPAFRHACTHLRGVSPPACTVRSARIFVLGFLKVLFPELPLPSTTLHVTYPWGWTNSLIVPFPHDMLDARLGFGTLAERTSKQPGKPGTQHQRRGYRRWRAESSRWALCSRMNRILISILCVIATAGCGRSGAPQIASERGDHKTVPSAVELPPVLAPNDADISNYYRWAQAAVHNPSVWKNAGKELPTHLQIHTNIGCSARWRDDVVRIHVPVILTTPDKIDPNLTVVVTFRYPSNDIIGIHATHIIH
jgi:hypothetical protein